MVIGTTFHTYQTNQFQAKTKYLHIMPGTYTGLTKKLWTFEATPYFQYSLNIIAILIF